MKHFIFLVHICLSVSLFGANDPHPHVCVNMIVKDEAAVITRCLASVKPYIDCWIIVDTGSTDGTQQIIKQFMQDIPGELHERPWVNFAHNRNEALELAKDKADYLLIIDADEVLEAKPGFSFPSLDKDFYYIQTKFGGIHYLRTQLINNHLNWQWKGVVHEVLVSDDAKTFGTIEGLANIPRPDGNRSQDPKKYEKDVALLEADLLQNPFNTRSQFYLAQSYRDAGNAERAIIEYKKRVEMGGWPEEVYVSLLQIAKLKDRLHYPDEEVVQSYFDAFHYRPSRAEPLYYLALHYRLRGDYQSAYRTSLLGSTIPDTKDVLFVEDWIYSYGMLMELSIAEYWTDRFLESLRTTNQMLHVANLPKNFREAAERNLYWINLRLPGIARLD